MFRTREEIRESQKAVPNFKITDHRQAEILANMFYAACSWIGGLENITYDYAEDDEEYINAVEQLEDHEALVGDIEAMCLTGFYGCGIEGPQYPYQKHYNLAGNDFIHRCAEAVVTAMGH